MKNVVANHKGIMKKLAAVFALLLICTNVFAEGLGDIKSSQAYKQYSGRPQTELSKLIYLLDRFNAPNVEIKLDGNIYSTDKAFPYSKGYLAKNYKKENAEDWIRAHCYRSNDKNEVIYMRVGEEDFRPVRDILIEELQNLKTVKK